MAAQEEHRLGVHQLAGQLAYRLDGLQRLRHQLGHLLQLLDEPDHLFVPRHTADLGQEEPDQQAGRDLTEEGLGSRHPDLGAAVGVEHRVRLARDGRSDRVADRQHPGVLLPGVLHCHQGVQRLAALGDRDHERAAVEHRIPVAEFAGELDLAGKPRPVFDRVLGDHSGVVSGTARDDEDLADLAQLLGIEPKLVELDLARRPTAGPATCLPGPAAAR